MDASVVAIGAVLAHGASLIVGAFGVSRRRFSHLVPHASRTIETLTYRAARAIAQS